MVAYVFDELVDFSGGGTKFMHRTLPIAIVAISLFLPACNKKVKDDEAKPATATEAVQKETAEAYEALKSYATKKHEEYREKAEAALKSYEKQFNELKAKIDKASGKARKKYEETEKAWQEKRQALTKQLDDLKTSSVKAWEEMEKKIDARMEELKKLYEKGRSAFA
jgi:DNA repair exonuclease SbcCD ATPase subunit